MSDAISHEVTERVVQWVREEMGALVRSKLETTLQEVLTSRAGAGL